jgi:hypothetical protein
MAGQLSARLSARFQLAPLYRLSPLTLSRISVGFALIAALWLAAASVRGEVIALFAALAVFLCGYGGRMVAGQRAVAVTEWGLASCSVVAEIAVYAGIASAATHWPARSWPASAVPAAPGCGGWRSSRSSSRR